MLYLPTAFLALLVVAPVDGLETAAPPARRMEASASVSTGTPSVLTGLALGVTAEVSRRLGAGPLFLAARLQWTEASAANDAWIIDHHQIVGAAAVGVAATLGAGRVWVEAGGGAAALYEILSRHQIERIQAAGVPGGTESTFALGPYAFAEAGIGLRLRDPVRGFLAAGPTVTRTNVDGGALWRAGGLARIGVAYDF